MTARSHFIGAVTPGVNVDAIDYEAGAAMAEAQGFASNYLDGMVVTYALQRHARGEEDGAERTWIGHFGPASFTGWRMVLAAAVAADQRNTNTNTKEQQS